MIPRPPESCPIPGATGCVKVWGNTSSKILFVGEAAGKYEAIKGMPFVGDAGTQLDRLLRFIKRDRHEFRIVNTKLCHPPNDWLVGAPWENSYCGACEEQLEEALLGPQKVVVPLGATALRKIMRLPKKKGKEGGQLNDWHGAPIRDPEDRFWVVATYHPAHLLRGAQKLTKTVAFDIRTAIELSEGSWEFDQPELVIDPPIDWFEAYVERYLEIRHEVWLASDIETEDKEKETDEGELGRGRDTAITRVNVSYDPSLGVTVPAAEPYWTLLKKLWEQDGTKVVWNGPYDLPIMRAHGVKIVQPWWDFMDAFHVLHPQLPRGLGFVAPFYSKTGPYKHLGSRNLTYCAYDGVTELRCAYGIAKDLETFGTWEVFLRDCWKRDVYSLHPATEVGLPMNWGKLEGEFIPALTKAVEAADRRLAEIIPDEVKPLDGPYSKKPVWDPAKEYEDGWTGEVVEKAEGEIRICETCKQEKVVAKHRCKGWQCSGCGRLFAKKPKKKDGSCCERPEIDKAAPRVVTTPVGSIRYYKKLPFNPGSPPQVLAYIKFKGHRPGRAKKTGKDSTDKKALNRLIKTGDPFYATLLERRQADKMKGTYGTGMVEKRGADGRLHGEFGHLPWTMRTNSTNPNMQNLADHVKWAAEFKMCVEAGEG